MDRRDFFFFSAASSLLGALPATAVPPPLPPSPEQEVRVRLNSQREAWNRGDLAAFCDEYADDCVFLSPSGVTRGRAPLFERYQKKYGAAKETMGTLSFEEVDVEATAEMVALAMKWKLTWKDKPEASGHTLITWRKINGKWKLVQDASM